MIFTVTSFTLSSYTTGTSTSGLPGSNGDIVLVDFSFISAISSGVYVGPSPFTTAGVLALSSHTINPIAPLSVEPTAWVSIVYAPSSGGILNSITQESAGPAVTVCPPGSIASGLPCQYT